jgi:hypothetical protein
MNDFQALEIDPTLLFHVTGGAGGQPNIKDQCGLPPQNGNSSSWNLGFNLPLSKIPYVGRFLPDITANGGGQRTSDYKTCVDAVTGGNRK